ncbi:MAG: 6-carboxytetrahydropterin synthase [Deltaproteobacteria bacterium]|nr:6-carboxytetrahydropterin synthase [Deltaproteobacteria bacterium]MBI4223932.1 6-carboxytetrahydropterin synthase [Deltaproteobacteria bacterium]
MEEDSLPKYQVIKQIDFCYGHRLLHYEGKCRHLHGHNGKVELVLAVESLDRRGMAYDFTDIKKAVKTWIDEKLDHRMILHEGDPALPVLREMNEPLFVLKENPTAENIARLIFNEAKEMGLPIQEVRLWETPDSCATYRP